MCGLKLVFHNLTYLNSCHTLRGCVDWNYPNSEQHILGSCHTLRGCVDWNFAFANGIYHEQESHPAWVCGLKHYRDYRLVDVRFVTPCVGVWIETQQVCPYKAGYWCHTLRGCVDWNSISLQYGLGGMVTPCVGVWIETRSTLLAFLTSSSHPAWVCGLKLITIILMLHRLCHTLRGCVDWNLYQLVPYIFPQSHTLRGCVDWNLVCRHGK